MTAFDIEKDPGLRVAAKSIMFKLGHQGRFPVGWPNGEYRRAEVRALVAFRNFRTIDRIQRRRAALEGIDLGGEA